MTDATAHSTYKLPSYYQDNRIVLLPRDPQCLFAYWEVSNDLIKAFIEEFGDKFLEKTTPVLKLANISKNTSAYINLNDEADSWYIHIDEPGCVYAAELGRMISGRFFIGLIASNPVLVPGNAEYPENIPCFSDYKEVRSKKSELASAQNDNTKGLRTASRFEFGPSSPHIYGIEISEAFPGVSSAEIFGIGKEHFVFGVSSVEVYGITLEEHIGISSNELFWK